MPGRKIYGLFVLFGSCCALLAACSSSDDGGNPPGASGGSGGSSSSGGSPATGSTPGSGGAKNSGGSATGNGGTQAGGGLSASGGAAPSNGGTNPGGAGGTPSNGGTNPGTGSAPANGGNGGGPPVGACHLDSSACTSAQVRITEIDMGGTVVVNENDAALKLLSISPVPSGGSRVAWMSNDSKVHVTTLDCDDHVTGTFALPAMDYGDIYADDKGGVLLVTRDAQGGGTLNCGEPTNLCGTPPSPAVPCYDMYMVRFDGSPSTATETWATKLTTTSAALPPYSTGPKGPQTYFIWWYAHHGRLAFDGTNWAGYYGAATSISQACTTGGNTAINIHQGDEMRVVDPSGAMLTGHDSFTWGCSHSGFEKIVWDPGAKRYQMICRSDAYPQPGLNVNASKLVSAISPSMSAVSNIVLSSTANNYWTLVSNNGELHLFRFTTAGGTAADITVGNGDKPHLVKYGKYIFGAWLPAGAQTMVGQVFDAATGATVGGQIPIAAPSNQFQDFRDYADGSAAYPAPGSSNTKLKIVRVMPCTG